jgi:hypothetical protein
MVLTTLPSLTVDQIPVGVCLDRFRKASGNTDGVVAEFWPETEL